LTRRIGAYCCHLFGIAKHRYANTVVMTGFAFLLFSSCVTAPKHARLALSQRGYAQD